MQFGRGGGGHTARAVAAWLCHLYTDATLGESAEWLGLSRADSVPNLTRRFRAQLKSLPELLCDVEELAFMRLVRQSLTEFLESKPWVKSVGNCYWHDSDEVRVGLRFDVDVHTPNGDSISLEVTTARGAQ
jgi:hypothetical protein